MHKSIISLLLLLLAVLQVHSGASAPVIVTTHLDENSPNASTSLREALEIVLNDPSKDAIVFNTEPSLGTDFDASTHTIFLSLGALDIFESVNIVAPDIGVILDAQSNHHVLQVDFDVNIAIQNITFQNGNSYNGGGITNFGNLALSKCKIINNRSQDNGGGILSYGFLSLDQCEVSDNFALSSGGGIYISSGFEGSLPSQITRSSITSNVSQYNGGGIYTETQQVSISNTTISHNQAQQGGGINHNNGTLFLFHSTLSHNQSTYGLGGGISNNGELILGNSIIANSFGPDYDGGAHELIGVNLVEDGSLYSSHTGDPGLLPLAYNGGCVKTHGLGTGSPAIDEGSDLEHNNITYTFATDARGVARIANGAHSLQPDLGAVEMDGAFPILNDLDENALTLFTTMDPLIVDDSLTGASPAGGTYTLQGNPISVFNPTTMGAGTFDIIYTTTNSQGVETSTSFTITVIDPFIVTTDKDNMLDDGLTSLREAMNEAANQPGLVGIAFNTDPLMGTDFDEEQQTILLENGFLWTDQEIIIIAPEATGLVLDGGPTNSPGESHILEVHLGGDVSLENITFQNGHNSQFGGGAIQNEGRITLTKCQFLDNKTPNGYGGAIWNSHELVAKDCNFAQNHAGEGGAVFNTGTQMTLENCSFYQNSSTSQGGAIYNYDAQITHLVNCTISNNTSEIGAGLSNYASSQTTVTHCTIYQNTSSAFGGGIYSAGGTMSISNSIVAASTNGDIYDGGTLFNLQNTLVGDGSLSSTYSGDPLLKPLADNGGCVWTHALSEESPAIDAGDEIYSLDADGYALGTDARGIARVADGNEDTIALVDLGAFEAHSYDFPPEVAQFSQQADGSIAIAFESTIGTEYTIQYSHNMIDWVDVGDPQVANGTSQTWVDDGTETSSHPSTEPARFYRISEVPPAE